jgi:hypothetical protein
LNDARGRARPLRARDPVSPFHDLGRRCGGLFPAVSPRSRPSCCPTSAARARPGANADPLVISIPRLAGLFSLGVLGLVGLLSLGIGGVVLVQGYVFRASEVGTQELVGPSLLAETSSPSANARRGPGTSAKSTAAGPTAEVPGNGHSARQRWAAQFGPAPRRPGSISMNQPETPETAYVETSTTP